MEANNIGTSSKGTTDQFQDCLQNEGVLAFRGFLVAIPISLVMWVLMVAFTRMLF